jgi:endonuclease YncB( thermonuclease family)
MNLFVKQRVAQGYWKIGKYIDEHLLEHKDRADYGTTLFEELAKDIDYDKSALQRATQFYRIYPIIAGRRQLSWNHYKSLITVKDPTERKRLEKEIIRKDWAAEKFQKYLSQRRAIDVAKTVPQKPLTPLRGTLYTYKIVTRPQVAAEKESGLLVDLGFGIFRNVGPKRPKGSPERSPEGSEGRSEGLSGFADGDVVESRPKDDARPKGSPAGYKFFKGSRTAKDLFTYAAYVERVVDGDTLKVRFDLGFDTWVRETLRLRGLDCPGMDTKEGQAAKTFVQSYINPIFDPKVKNRPKGRLIQSPKGDLIKPVGVAPKNAKGIFRGKEAQLVVVRSSRSEKYGRYLADVYIPQGSDPATDLYLNNLLLENGHAVRVE